MNTIEARLRSMLGPDRSETDEELRERVVRAYDVLKWACPPVWCPRGSPLDRYAENCGLKRENVPTLKDPPAVKSGPVFEAARVVRTAEKEDADLAHSSMGLASELRLCWQAVMSLARVVRELAEKVDK